MTATAQIQPPAHGTGDRSAAPTPAAATPSRGPAGVLVDVVALTADMGLFQATREAVGERNPVWRARSAEEAADLLINGRCGVLLIDMAGVSVRADTLIEQVVEQFPDVVVCVAGTREDEPLLVPLITAGLVYRFIHKPVSPRRAGMFLQAAIRRHAEHRAGSADDAALLPLLRSLTRHSAGAPRRYAVAFALVCAALVSLLFVRGTPAVLTAEAPTVAVVAPTPDPIQAPASTRADPVLSRARAALQAGRLESPEGRNALDLFEAVLLAQPDHPEARAGLDATIARLLERARRQAAAGRKAEADRLLQRVLAVDPGHAAATTLVQQVSPPDLPSRQLVREQVAEVRQRELERSAAASPPPPAPRTAPIATGPLPEPVSSAYLASLATRAQAPPPVVRRLAVETDPLAPRYVNAAPGKRVASWRRGVPTGAPLPAALPIAGIAPEEPAAPAAASQRVPHVAVDAVPTDGLDRVAGPDPVYPSEALRARTRGWVELEFTITPSGSVRDLEVRGARPIGVFEDAATAALAQWRFRPRVVNGQAVPQRSTITLRFDVDD